MVGNKYALAVVGYGGMGKWHVNLVRERIDSMVLAGIYDIKQERMDEANKEGIKTYGSLEEVLSDKTVDIVLVATPNDSHRPIVIQALKAGKNVVCEKPVALNSQELEEMIDTANAENRIFTVHQNRRWDKDYLTMKKIIDNNMVGDIYHIESRVHGSRGIPGDWRGKKEHGGGMVLDWGVHILDQMLLLWDEKVTKVYCELTHITNFEVDDGFRIHLTFESGRTALLEVGTHHFIQLPRWYMIGRDGTAVIEDWSLKGKIVKVLKWDEGDVAPVQTAAGLTKTMAPRTASSVTTLDLPTVQSDITDFYKNVMGAISGEAELIVQHDQVRRVMRLMEAAFESARLGQTVVFEE